MQTLLAAYSIFTIVILSAMSFSCSSSVSTTKESEEAQAISAPAWVSSVTKAGYATNRYLVGRGMAQASGNIVTEQNLADSRAFSEIANQILVSIKSDISVSQIEISTGKASEIRGATTANIAITSSIVVSGLTIVDRFYSPQDRVYYSLAVLDREIASAPFRTRLIELRSQYESSLRLFRQFRAQGKILRSLNELKQAYGFIHLFNDIIPYYRLFQSTSNLYGDDFQTLPTSDVNSLALEILVNLSIVKIRGDAQEGLVGRPLPIPLEVKVFLRDTTDIPAEGLTTLFRFTTGSGKITERVVTDRNGIASSNVEVLQRSETGLYSIKATLDFSEMIDTAAIFSDWNRVFKLSTPSTIFNIRLKKAPALKVLLVIDEDNSSGSISVEAFSRELTKAGFSPLTEKDIGRVNSVRVRQLLKQNNVERMQSEFLSTFSIVMLGEFHTAFSNQYQGIQIYTVTGNVKAVSIEHNKVIAEESFADVKGFGNNVDQAKISALQKAGQRVAESVISQILSE